MSNDEQTHSPDDSLEGLDHGLAEAFGDKPQPSDPPSVLERISNLTGSRPQVSLRDLPLDESTLLKPLGPEEAREAEKYAVHGELGRGGVGTVHRGHDHDLGRDVAMKFLHERYSKDPAILHRFVEEAQIGGQLQHPGIVPVYDLGMKDGKPFFTMKLVKGQTLAKKLADRSSPADDRATVLSIFEDVCQTMAYAHARGVVHRDLKPANIMIGSFGEVQVVDWGMGKVLQSGGVDDEELAARRHAEQSVIETVRSGKHGSQSIVGSVMGTPPYMPPEQARGEVEAMDERSDVFALGAILCEILTGQPPYVGDPVDLILRAANCDLADAHARLEACDADPDLVQLASQCLAPAPAARPRSAEVLAKAVHGHLASVQARLDDARVEAAEAQVRAESLRRTQKLGLGFTAVIAAALVVTFVQWRSADTARGAELEARGLAEVAAEEAREETARAERELGRANGIKQLLAEVLVSVVPVEAGGEDPGMMLGILERTTERLDGGGIEDPLARAEVEQLVGVIYRNLGRYDEAKTYLTAGVDGLERELGDKNLATQIGRLNEALLWKLQGEPERALAAFEVLRDELLESEGPEDIHTLDVMSNIAVLHERAGDYGLAEARYRELVEVRERAFGATHEGTLTMRNSLAGVLALVGKTDEAHALVDATLELAIEALGEDHVVVLDCRTRKYEATFSQGLYDEAARLGAEVVEASIEVYGPEHPKTLGRKTSAATSWMMAGQHDRAERTLLEVREAQHRVLGEGHPKTLAVLSRLAQLSLVRGRPDEAEERLREVLELQREVLGPDHKETLSTTNNLGFVLVSLGRLEEAATQLEQGLADTRRVLGPQHDWARKAMGSLAVAYEGLGREADARAMHLERREQWIAELESPRVTPFQLYAFASELLWHPTVELQDPELAKVYARRAVDMTEATGGKELMQSLIYLTQAQHRTGEHAEAAASLRRAIDLMPDGPDATAQALLAEIEAAL